jgi:formylmethanofuran dehydrogenase subunit E
MPAEKREFESAVKNAVKLHGHLGPFLVIGVRMGVLAKKMLKSQTGVRNRLRVTVRVPLSTPFSCAIDGIQTTTSCTVGNRRLRVENSKTKIDAYFELLREGSSKTLHISVNQRMVQTLTEKLSKGMTNEQLAAQVASMPEDQLFTLEKGQM